MAKLLNEIQEKPTTYRDLMVSKIALLDKRRRSRLEFGDPSLTQGVAVISSFLINVSLKRSLLLYEGAITSGILSGITAVISNYGLYRISSDRLLTDPFLCPTCAAIRGGLIQGTTSTIIPLTASIALAGILGDRYRSVDIPSFSWKNRVEFVKFWGKALTPLKRIFAISFVLQSGFGFCYGYLRKLTVDELHDSVTQEEFAPLMGSLSSEIEVLKNYNR